MSSTTCRCQAASTPTSSSATPRLPITSDQHAIASKISDTANAIGVHLLSVHVNAVPSNCSLPPPACPALRRICTELAQLPIRRSNLNAEEHWPVLALDAQQSATLRRAGQQSLRIRVQRQQRHHRVDAGRVLTPEEHVAAVLERQRRH